MSTDDAIIIKTDAEINIMSEGGEKLARIKEQLKESIKDGVSAYEIDRLAQDLIENEGGKPSFKMVKNYYWATCVNVNEGVVHGIPKKEILLKRGDVVSVDVGMFYKGFHTDTSFTLAINADRKLNKFLQVGKKALDLAISKATPQARVHDISLAIDSTLKKSGYNPVKALTGHGIGRNLHEEPQIPCFVEVERSKSSKIPEGAVLAIEVIYSMGSSDVTLSRDGWTISTSDAKISALFEETVAVTKEGPKILTN